MTKKHYEAIALIIKSENEKLPTKNSSQYYDLAHHLGLYFMNDNPNFKFDRFMHACGYDDYNPF